MPRRIFIFLGILFAWSGSLSLAWDLDEGLSPTGWNRTQDYTHQIEGIGGNIENVSLSWCELDRRIPKSPETRVILDPTPIQIAAPRNDFESFQVVLFPTVYAVSDLKAKVSELTGPNQETISQENIELRYGYYHKVTCPTDRVCEKGWYVDALVPLASGADGFGAPISIPVEENFPLYVTVHIPENTPAGLYTGTLSLTDAVKTFDCTIPFSVEVWDFDQPKKNRFSTAFGLGLGRVADVMDYPWDQNTMMPLWEQYLKCASDHRISIRQTLPFSSYMNYFNKETLAVTLDFTLFDAEMERLISLYNVTDFQIDLRGIGIGSQHGASPHAIYDYPEESEEYQQIMASYLGQLNDHLKEKGWVDRCYTYWYDEPREEHYDHVARGFAILKKYAPDLKRMLTEDPSDHLTEMLKEKGGNVDIWCPVTYKYDESEMQKRLDEGETAWWYVCAEPKAPYCTEFIDHPAHELRVLHWQAFERNVTGFLMWISNEWHTSWDGNGPLKNPYLDPTSHGGFSDASGPVCQGNGDGVFFYPPLSAAVPGRKRSELNTDPPVASLRLEEVREGIEDYEMLLTLKERYEAKKETLSQAEAQEIEKIFDLSDISTSLTSFTSDPQVILQHRRRVAEAILRLGAEE